MEKIGRRDGSHLSRMVLCFDKNDLQSRVRHVLVLERLSRDDDDGGQCSQHFRRERVEGPAIGLG